MSDPKNLVLSELAISTLIGLIPVIARLVEPQDPDLAKRLKDFKPKKWPTEIVEDELESAVMALINTKPDRTP